jgi:flagella basal body P-ring formation protein FlgA
MTLAALAILSAAAFADPAAIDRAVEEFTGAPAGVEGGARTPVDRRLRLAACAVPLALSWHGTARGNVLVQCPQVPGWRIFVPVAGAASAPAAAPAIMRGDPVTIAVAGAGFSVSQPGEALESGTVGSWIRVRGLAAKAQPLRARVVRAGLVELPVD